MYYGNIKKFDIADGEGVRVSLFVSGCRNHCKGCFQPSTWDFRYGNLFTEDTENELLEALKPDYIEGLSLLGGEPMEPENQRDLVPFLRRFRTQYPEKTLWVYTGCVLEQDLVPQGRAFTEVTEEFLSYTDVLVDGPFIEEQKNVMLSFRGSENQRVIDMNKTRTEGHLVLYPTRH